MKNRQIKLTNISGENIILSLEPEGTILELLHNNSVFVDLSPSINPIIDLQIHKDDNGIYLSFWPENGNYEIVIPVVD